MNIWRLNVRETQIVECIKYKKFAIDKRPKNPEIQKGDILLLQLVVYDASQLDKKDTRIEFALVFDHLIEDFNGSMSSLYWPRANKTWHWILECSEIVTTVPFSLQNLDLHHKYAGQTNPVRIKEDDVEKLFPFILSCHEVQDIGLAVHKTITEEIKDPAKRERNLWALIQNNDRIVEGCPDQIEWTIVPSSKTIKRNPELPCVLKELYKYKCQICGYDFQPRWGKPYSETHHIHWLSRGGIDHSNNIIVVCPNHHRIIHETKPNFNREELFFTYPNGLREDIHFREHLKDKNLILNIEKWSMERAKRIDMTSYLI
jgi:5-methylcytosine-specific restriction endonuclease McrA